MLYKYLKLLFIIIFCVLFFNKASAQTLKQQFNELLSKKDTSAQILFLEKWEKADSTDPELFVAYFNYYFYKSKNDVVTLGKNPKGNKVINIMDTDTSIKEPVAFLYNSSIYDSACISKGFEWISKGIAKYPDRLDMRFGKIYVFGEIEDYENFTKELIKTIDYSSLNKNKWTWAENKPLEEPEKFFLSSIQDYQVQIYNTEDDDLLVYMKQIAETVLKYHPEHIESLSNLSLVYMINQEYDKALEYLLRAVKINPKDLIVLNNIAQAYKLKGDKTNAIKYYELVIKHGDERAQYSAKKHIEELNKP